MDKQYMISIIVEIVSQEEVVAYVVDEPWRDSSTIQTRTPGHGSVSVATELVMLCVMQMKHDAEMHSPMELNNVMMAPMVSPMMAVMTYVKTQVPVEEEVAAA